MFDIAIIGGGPAGATLARMVATRMGEKCKILLVDRRRLTQEVDVGSFRKCCGGLVAPDAQKMLARMGLALPKSVLVGPQIFAVRTIDLSVGLERYYQRFYINIDREKFDRWLVSQIPDNAEIMDDCLFKSYEQSGNGYRLKLLYKGKIIERTVRIIIGADGAFSQVRKQAFGEKKWPKRYISIQKWYKSQKTSPYFGAIFDPEITDFYSWIIPKEDLLILGAALEMGENVHQKFELLKLKLENFGYQFGEETKKEGAFILRPLNLGQINTGKAGILLIGEAAGWISPSSAEGLSYAFRSAMILADSINQGFTGLDSRYKRRCRKLFANVLLKNVKSPAMYGQRLRQLVLRSGIESLDVWE